MVWLEAETGRYDGFAETVAQSRPDLALVALDGDPQRALALVDRITHDVPDCTVLTVSSSQEGSLILQAMRAGAKEFLSHPLKIDDFVAALDRIRLAGGGERGGRQTARGNRVIAVAGVGGGVGCTSPGGEPRLRAGRRGPQQRDRDRPRPRAGRRRRLARHYPGLYDSGRRGEPLPARLFAAQTQPHPARLRRLPAAPPGADGGDGHDGRRRSKTGDLPAAGDVFSHLVIDIGKSYGALDQTVLDAADDILLVCQLDLPALRNVVRVLQYLDLQEKNAPKVKIVLNRMGLTDRQISVTKAMETIGREVYWKLPNDYGTMIESRNNGVPLISHAPTSRLTESVRGLAAKLDGSDAGTALPTGGASKGLFRFLSKSAS